MTDSGVITDGGVEPDSWFNHLLRMGGVWLAQSLAVYACFAGLVWEAHTFGRTGYRKRDILLSFIPIYGVVVVSRVMWRYTARHVYWTPRDDRPSDILRGWQRPAAIAGGWLAFPVAVAIGVAAGLASSGWSDADRADVREVLLDSGYTGSEARCIVDELESRIDDPDLVSQDDFDDAFAVAVDLCTLR